MPQKACRGAAAPLGVWEQGPEQGLSTESLSGESFLLNLASVCPLLAGPRPVHTPPNPPPGRRVLSKAQGLSISPGPSDSHRGHLGRKRATMWQLGVRTVQSEVFHPKGPRRGRWSPLQAAPHSPPARDNTLTLRAQLYEPTNPLLCPGLFWQLQS